MEPREAAQALLADAAARGAVLHLDQPVTGLPRRGDRVAGIDTAAGPLEADAVVVAAGVGTAKVLATAGLLLPLDAPPGLLVHTRPHRRVLNGVVIAPELHMRQARSGQILCGSDFGGTDPGVDPAAAAADLFARLRRALRGGGDLVLDRFTVGHRPVPEGGTPMVGPVEGAPGLSVAVMHSGITLAPAIGQFMTAELLDDRRDPLLAPFAPRVTIGSATS